MPYCPHCNRNTFETVTVDVGETKYNCVQCAGCKAPVSFDQHSQVGKSKEDFETRMTDVLRVVVSSLQAINSRLIRMEQIMQSRQ